MDELRIEETGDPMSTPTRFDPETSAGGSAPADVRPPAAAVNQGSGWPEAVTVFVAMVLAAVALSAVFSDFAWLPPVLVSIALIVIVGLIFRSVPVLRASGTAVIAQCVVGVIAVFVLCAPDTLMLGIIPSGSSFTTVIDLLSSGVSDLYATTPPAASTPGFTAMLTIAFTLITILIDGLVSDLKAPKVSGVLLLVLWMIPVFFAPAQVRWWHVVAILAAFLLLMLSRYLPSTRWRGGLTALVAGALAVGIGIGIPVLLPPVPTLPDRAASDKGDLTVTNPFLDLRKDLGDRDDAVLFSYQTTDPDAEPIRLTSIDSFDGQAWAPSPFSLDPFAIASEGMPWPEGLPRDRNFKEETIDVTVGDDFDQQYLPTPYAPQQPDGLDRRWIYDEKSLTIVGNGEKSGGQQYSMQYLSADPGVDDLKTASPVSTGDFETELEVPESLPDTVHETAERVTADANNQWEAAVLLQAYFRSGEFEYSLDAPEKASGDAISDFLADKKGYCVQFSSAMTIMARTMGIPARIGVGYASGEESDGGYDVSMQDSHAWPELYFEGVGWVRFEPTPGGPAGDPPKWTVASGSEQDDSADEEETSDPSEEATDGAEETEAAESEAPSEEESTEAAEPAGSNFSTFAWAGVIVLVLVLLALIPAIWRMILRSRRTKDPQNLEAVWTEVRALATDYGQSIDPSGTLRYNELVLAGVAPRAGTEDSSFSSPSSRRSSGSASRPDSGSASGSNSGTAAPKSAAAVATGAGNGRDGGGEASADVAGGTSSDGTASEGSDRSRRGDERFNALRRPAPAGTSARAHDDTALAAFIAALEAQRYGSTSQSIDSSEVSALVDEVSSDLADRARPGTKISAKLWPASIFNPPR
ncbi:transglutaminaseTgpA domain-containing protein [Brevibacterium sp. GP-SGM9]|uniref:transglutaminase family protein n=1 Tax=Brevibacterium sp. GP-SGM9 TaxID=3376990 RepID=UPI0039A46C09